MITSFFFRCLKNRYGWRFVDNGLIIRGLARIGCFYLRAVFKGFGGNDVRTVHELNIKSTFREKGDKKQKRFKARGMCF